MADRLTSVDPATGETLWDGPTASAEDVDAALARALRAMPDWAGRPTGEHDEIVRSFASRLETDREELARVIATETGKPLWEAGTEVAAMIGKIEHSIRSRDQRAGTVHADVGGVASVVRHRPHGVAAVLGPYNFPGHLPNGHIVPALLAGNAVVFKPSELTPWVGEEMRLRWLAAGLPPDLFQVVQGGRPTGEALVGSPRIDALLFTGSAATGQALHRQLAGRTEVLLALEMGGNNPLVVRPVDDLDAAVHLTVQSAFLTAGQRCTCARRVVVPAGEWGDRFVDRLVWAAESIVVGAPFDEPPPFCGPLISAAAADGLMRAHHLLVEAGGRSLLPMERGEHGFVTPALVDVTGCDVPDEEWFGPLVQIHRVDSLDRAIEVANDTRFGLAAGIITDEQAEWDEFLVRSRAGIVNRNRPTTGASSAAPFGGIGHSGNHRPAAFYAADFCAYPVASLVSDRAVRPDQVGPGLPW